MGSVKNAGAFVVVLVASFTVMNGLPVDGLRSACGQELVLAFVALAGVGLACPEVLVKRCTHDAQHVRTVCNVIAAIGAVGAAITLAAWGFGGATIVGPLAWAAVPSVQDAAMRLILLLTICVLTAVFEESLMRALCINALRGALGANGKPRAGATRHAMLLAALLFALLHVGVPDVAASTVVVFQSALKFVQATLFALVMGALYVETASLRPCIAAHAAFDALYLGPTVVLTGALPATYASGLPFDTALLAATTVLLAALLLALHRKAVRRCKCCAIPGAPD